MGASEPKGSSRLGREGASGRWVGPLGNEGRQVKPPCSLRETPSQPTNRFPDFCSTGGRPWESASPSPCPFTPLSFSFFILWAPGTGSEQSMPLLLTPSSLAPPGPPSLM